MTAKETQAQLIKAIKDYATCNGVYEAQYKYAALIEKLTEHEDQICREQRESCLEHYNTGIKSVLTTEELVLNAPKPTI